MPNSFSPLSTFMASTASGMGRPPRMRTPSMSKAKAKLSATSGSVMGVRGAVMGDTGLGGVLSLSTGEQVPSVPLADSDGELGGSESSSPSSSSKMSSPSLLRAALNSSAKLLLEICRACMPGLWGVREEDMAWKKECVYV